MYKVNIVDSDGVHEFHFESKGPYVEAIKLLKHKCQGHRIHLDSSTFVFQSFNDLALEEMENFHANIT